MSTALDVRPSEAALAEGQDLPASMIERMTLILDLFKRPKTRLNLENVVSATNLPRSTAHRILTQLELTGWITHSASGYRLGWRALSLGGRDVEYGPLRAAAAPRLHELALRTDMTAHLAVLDYRDVYYLDKVGGQSATALPSQVGGRAPAHRTASGRAILAWLSPEQLDQLYDDLPLDGRASNLDALRGDLSTIRHRNGLSFVRGLFDTGSVALAVRGVDGPVAAISLSGRQDRSLERLVPQLVHHVRAIAADLRATDL
ncbi:IclR family transcriptional regulator [Pseudofrankia inefficax]|uniref:Transcriptional regulator, IclR family n=1 Tax=Pseudofrankia inefficax (strain DSM 45817 / CECT 9037 / DDB 130130 / EuI1c) TaxID=298654 RepID=E3IV92_PSEI1|nr:IclR family transcriptional regulator [Pseudofrankia inefficax]ADP81256.1 transcriptional regulator, IclR family [Pseudofrankia inefficax]